MLVEDCASSPPSIIKLGVKIPKPFRAIKLYQSIIKLGVKKMKKLFIKWVKKMIKRKSKQMGAGIAVVLAGAIKSVKKGNFDEAIKKVESGLDEF
jgi:hypothetical protein